MFVPLAAAAWLVVVVFATDPTAIRAARAKEVVLVYVGAEDCAPCRIWQARGEVALRASPEFSRLTYRAVKSPTLFDVMSDAYWPDDLKVYRERLGQGAGVPAWLVVANGEIVVHGQGASQWDKTVLPKVRSLLRSASTGAGEGMPVRRQDMCYSVI